MVKDVCCICNCKLDGYGNSPCPVNEDEQQKCCDECNWKVVIPARLEQAKEMANEA